MRSRFTLAATLMFLAGGAVAQTSEPAPQAPPTATPPAAPAAPRAAPDTTVSGITVKPLPRKQCAPKDKECVALVMAEVKELYPEQLKQFCFQQKMQIMRQNMQANIAGWCDGPFGGASELCHRYMPPAVKQICTSDPVAETNVKK